ncbi:YopT-type cysteine protease domain-containing protein [Roseomonas sp. BN140053]|uniref:YopT-type cysteine protease domain-containing protein n=1 Tax=Roseomonas sp. BN140053 TaxID=3391898 RepID=UPI0039ED1D2B
MRASLNLQHKPSGSSTRRSLEGAFHAFVAANRLAMFPCRKEILGAASVSLWNEVTVKAWNDGVLVYAMDQMDTAGARAPNGCPQGYCFGLASVWMRGLWKGEDYPYDAATRECTDTNWNAVQTQKVFDGELARAEQIEKATRVEGDIWPAVRNGFRRARLKLNNGRSQASKGGVEGTGIYNALQVGTNDTPGGDGVYLVSMRGIYGAHAFAIANLGDEWWRLFDGNYGHFCMKGNKTFKKFLEWYISGGGTSYRFRYGGSWLSANASPD